MFSTPLTGSFTCHTCGKLGWEQPNYSPTASVWEGGSHCWPHRVGVSLCHLAFIVVSLTEPNGDIVVYAEKISSAPEKI